ncbi:MAG: F0F1 ATP synthase subunit epsilon [bacterium]|nr:F0F1 ATP synthase subunit epsilon [bacterium]
MANNILFEILTPRGVVYKANVKHVKLPGIAGQFGVLPQHIPFMTTLDIGVIELDTIEGKQEKIAVSGGFVEVLPEKIVLFAETAETSEMIDLQRAQNALQRAEEKLKSATDEIEIERLKMAIARAKARIKAK